MANKSTDILFRTEIEPCAFPFTITHQHKLFTIGSCFADSIGSILEKNKFDVCINPAGTVFNPVSIHRILNASDKNDELPEADFCLRDGIYFSFDFHSSVSANSAQALIERIKLLNARIHHVLESTNYLFITYGTAWVYQLNDSFKIVANCHKMPAERFTRRLLSAEEIIKSFNEFADFLFKKNPGLKIILTVSPVRHTRDSLTLNSVSKSVLRVACHQLCNQKNIFYFPAYEMMMDDLRDYRFYERDLIHPNSLALDYIWQRLVQAVIPLDTIELLNRLDEINRDLYHRPANINAPSYISFLENIHRRLMHISKQVNVAEELVQIEAKLKLARQ